MKHAIFGLMVVPILGWTISHFLLLKTPSPSATATAPIASSLPKVPAPAAPHSEAQTGQPLSEQSPERIASPQNRSLDNVYDLLKEGRKEAAVIELKAILKENPNHEAALLELAMLFTRNPKTQAAAIAALEKVLTINPSNDTAVGEMLQLSREGVAVGPRLEKLSAQFPDSANLNAGLGFWYLTQRRYPEAQRLLEKGTHDPDFAEASYNSLTRLYQETQDNQRLIATFKSWIAEQSRNIDQLKAKNEDFRPLQYQNLITRIRLADTLRQMGNTREAEQMVRDVLAASPHQPDALALLKRLN